MHKKARPHWLIELENEINEEVEKQLKGKGLKVTLYLEYDTNPLPDKFQDKKLALAGNFVLTASYDSNASVADEIKLNKITSDKMDKRLRKEGLFS